MRRILLLLPLLLLAACQRGVVLSGQGVRDNTPENARVHVERLIARDLDTAMPGRGRAEVMIAELPTWSDGARTGRDEGWFWQRATVTIAVVHAGETPPTLGDDVVRRAISARLRPAVAAGGRDIAVRVDRRRDALRFAELDAERGAAAPPAEPGRAAVAPRQPAPTPAPAKAKTYVVSDGDTLADISTAFYGSPAHWRAIRDANPGIDGSDLRPGTVLTIPPKP